MLEQAEIQPGMRVLEIGSGGYNALLAELAGPTGQVVTVDIDPAVADRARLFLDQAGYPQVKVVLADAENGVPEYAPFDRILVTAGAWDAPPTWSRQLAERGRIVMPLRTRGVTRTVAFDPDGDRLVSVSSAPCGFVPMQGAGAHGERLWLLSGNRIGLLVDDGELEEPDRLSGVFSRERSECWSGVTIGRSEPFDHLFLWFATSLRGFARLMVDREQGDPGLAAGPGEKYFPFAHVVGDAIGYMTIRPSVDPVRVEIGARAFGASGPNAAADMAESIRIWDGQVRHGPGPRYAVFPAGTPVSELPDGYVLDKRHCRIVISWPAGS